MAKPGQRIVKGMLPQFPNIGNESEKQKERGKCQRCGAAGKLRKVEVKAGQPMKLCDACTKARGERSFGVADRLREIDQAAVERFRRATK